MEYNASLLALYLHPRRDAARYVTTIRGHNAVKIEQKKSFANHTICRIKSFHYLRGKLIEMLSFFIILPILYLAGNVYIFWRGRQALKSQSTGVKVLLSIIFWGGAFSFFSSFLFRNLNMPASLAQTISQVGTGWLVFTLYMVLALVVFDLLRLFHIHCKYSFHLSLFLTLSLLGYGNYHYQHPDTKVINMVINKPADTDGQPLKVVAISDVHLGYATNKAMLEGYVDLINAERPDLVIIGGDLIDNSVVPLHHEHMEVELSRIYAPLGVYMVPGNHEYISGIEESEKFIAKTPIVLLRDSVITLPNQVQLVGRDDRHNRGRKTLEQLTENLDPSKPVILLDHQPYELEKTEKAGVDLQFSGHTHRGQVWPMSWIVDRMFELSYGIKKTGNSTIYVSSGLSLWGPPFRIGTDSEMVVFNITFKE